ncbi:WD40 repeat domain-containing protein, partial [Lactobacillus helveticus]|uniref:WD40 repeat domain-containing protein n=1 Tax=Lactobacillus helveticus TaxID=1587 RepID=UPI003855299B
MDELMGHEGPVATLAFHPSGTVLASGGLDKSLILWDVFNTGEGGDRLKGIGEALQQTSEVLCTAFSHSGKRMAVLALNQEVS